MRNTIMPAEFLRAYGNWAVASSALFVNNCLRNHSAGCHLLLPQYLSAPTGTHNDIYLQLSFIVNSMLVVRRQEMSGLLQKDAFFGQLVRSYFLPLSTMPITPRSS